MAEDTTEAVDKRRSVFVENLITPLEDLEKLPVSYANAFQLSFTPDDGCIILCQRDMSNPNLLHGRSRVFMPLVQLKLLSLHLDNAIMQYEEKFGELSLSTLDRLTPEARKAYEENMKGNDLFDSSTGKDSNDD